MRGVPEELVAAVAAIKADGARITPADVLAKLQQRPEWADASLTLSVVRRAITKAPKPDEETRVKRCADKEHERERKRVRADRVRALPCGPAKKRGAPRTLTDEEREAAAQRHAAEKCRQSRIRTSVMQHIRAERQQAAEVKLQQHRQRVREDRERVAARLEERHAAVQLQAHPASQTAAGEATDPPANSARIRCATTTAVSPPKFTPRSPVLWPYAVPTARRTEFVHCTPHMNVCFEPLLVQQLHRLARRPFSPSGGERFQCAFDHCMQHGRMPSPKLEMPFVPEWAEACVDLPGGFSPAVHSDSE